MWIYLYINQVNKHRIEKEKDKRMNEQKKNIKIKKMKNRTEFSVIVSKFNQNKITYENRHHARYYYY